MNTFPFQVNARFTGPAVLLLFVVAIGAAQVRGQESLSDDEVTEVSLGPLVEHLRALESLPPVVEAVIEAPVRIELDLSQQRLVITRRTQDRSK
jgi:hypothetical protein